MSHAQPSAPSRAVRLGVAGLLLLHVALAVTSVLNKSPTFDETVHVTGGYSYWSRGDYRLNLEAGNLAQRLVATPLLLMDLQFPSVDSPAWRGSDAWKVALQFFYGMGNPTETMLLAARCVTLLMSVALGVLVFSWSSRWYGPRGGLLSLFLYALNPSIIANARLATSDLMASGLFVASAGLWWRTLERPSAGRLIGTTLCVASLAMTKVSGLLIVIVMLVLLLLRVSAMPTWVLPPTLGRLSARGRIGSLAMYTAVFAGIGLAVVVLVWAVYGFRFLLFADQSPQRLAHDIEGMLRELGPAVGGLLGWVRANQLLPEAFLNGAVATLAELSVRHAFLNGDYSPTGFVSFFPYALLLKTPLVLWACVAVSLWFAVRSNVVNGLVRSAPLWVLLVVYWTHALTSSINIGFRHILVTLPVMCIVAGGAIRWVERDGRRASWVLIGVVLVGAMECVWVHPHYLTYFNWLAGGPAGGHRHLVDSSSDWGQDLPGLRDWLVDHDLQGPASPPVYLAYFGSAPPAKYGIKAIPLPSYHEWAAKRPASLPALPGIYCISATLLQRVYGPFWGPWTTLLERNYRALDRFARRHDLYRRNLQPGPRLRMRPADLQARLRALEELQFGRLAIYLQTQEPLTVVGNTIFVYALDEAKLRQALGPTPARVQDAAAIGWDTGQWDLPPPARP